MTPKPHSVTSPLPDKAPQHVAVIMDGNGRWAKARGLPRVAGHKKGAEALRALLDGCRPLGVRYLTLYAFSAENWKRPTIEVSDLMGLLRHYLAREIETLHRNEIRLRVIGDVQKLEPDIRKQIEEAETLTRHNTAFHLTVALSYGGRQEIARAMTRLAEDISTEKVKKDNINEELISSYLDTRDMPDPDLLIRTGGEQRLSNFLLWQSAYAELFFTPVLWPDFTIEHFKTALAEYAQRERRYGSTHES